MWFTPAVVEFFKYKIASSIIILTCGGEFEHMKLLREVSQQGVSAIVVCEPVVLDRAHNRLQGVLYIHRPNDTLLDQVKHDHFAIWNKWLIIADEIPIRLQGVRYDADITLLSPSQRSTRITNAGTRASAVSATQQPLFFEDVYVHLRDGTSRHPWATWSEANGFQLSHERARLLRRIDLKRYPMRIATPVGYYDAARYRGSFDQYVLDNSMPERDSAIRCGYGASALILETLNAKVELVQVQLWITEDENSTSMITKVAAGTAELSGTTLRVWPDRIARFDYVMPIWPFKVGFTYLSERESSSNMYVMPFTGVVWGCCLAVALVLALAQRATAKAPAEKEGAYVAVIATWLQQDASAVPEGASGRLVFVVLSASSMLVHAYYTSAVVSALMSAGGGGPRQLRALADSRYQLASEDYDWIRTLMFDVETTWEDLEYLKRKKLTSSFYQSTARGMQLVREGSTAFHAEYNHIYPLLNTFSDEQICKLQYVHTVPETMSWVVTKKRGQWTDVLRSAGGWVLETGLATRLLSRWRVRPPPCRAALLAERVTYGDVAPLIMLTAVGFTASVLLLAAETLVARWSARAGRSAASDNGVIEEEIG